MEGSSGSAIGISPRGLSYHDGALAVFRFRGSRDLVLLLSEGSSGFGGGEVSLFSCLWRREEEKVKSRLASADIEVCESSIGGNIFQEGRRCSIVGVRGIAGHFDSITHQGGLDPTANQTKRLNHNRVAFIHSFNCFLVL